MDASTSSSDPVYLSDPELMSILIALKFYEDVGDIPTGDLRDKVLGLIGKQSWAPVLMEQWR